MGMLCHFFNCGADTPEIAGVFYSIPAGDDAEGGSAGLFGALGNVEYFAGVNEREFFYAGVVTGRLGTKTAILGALPLFGADDGARRYGMAKIP